jgi:hypothetical protein
MSSSRKLPSPSLTVAGNANGTSSARVSSNRIARTLTPAAGAPVESRTTPASAAGDDSVISTKPVEPTPAAMSLSTAIG